MWNTIFKINIVALFLLCSIVDAQLFNTKDRIDHREEDDLRQFSYGFYLVANNFDYKIVLDPKFGIDGNKNLVQPKASYGFGAGLIGRFRLNENFDLRIEPALQFVERELYFDTQSNNQYSDGTSPKLPLNQPFITRQLTEADKFRTIKSTYVDIPLLLEIHGDRWYNSRPYAAAGVNWMMNLQSNSKSEGDNSQGIFRSTASNFAWTAEIGIQFYFSRFKLTPGFRGTFMTNNEIVADDATTPPYWTSAMASAKSRAFMFVLKFE